MSRRQVVIVASGGANIALMAKTTEPHPKLPGTIYTAADEIISAGGQALPVPGDIRDVDQIQSAIARTVAQFGGIGDVGHDDHNTVDVALLIAHGTKIDGKLAKMAVTTHDLQFEIIDLCAAQDSL